MSASLSCKFSLRPIWKENQLQRYFADNAGIDFPPMKRNLFLMDFLL